MNQSFPSYGRDFHSASSSRSCVKTQEIFGNLVSLSGLQLLKTRLTYSHYNSIRIRAFIPMGVISIDLAILRKNAGHFWQFGKSNRTAYSENHTHSFDRDRLTPTTSRYESELS